MLDSPLFVYGLLPLLIFLARVCDVTLQTLRILAVSRGNKILAPILGFFEVIIWLLAIRQIMQNLSNPFCYIGYGAGFAMGNLIGILIEEKAAVGKLIVRIITRKNAAALVEALRRKGFGVTDIPANGKTGPVSVLYTIIDRVHLDRVIALIQEFNPRAFYTVEDIRSVQSGVFPSRQNLWQRMLAGPRKGLRRRRIYRNMRNVAQQRKGH